MAPNSASVSLRTKPPRSPAERLRLYREGIRHRPRRVCFKIKMNDARIEALVKRGYLKPSERDDTSAITQAQSATTDSTLSFSTNPRLSDQRGHSLPSALERIPIM